VFRTSTKINCFTQSFQTISRLLYTCENSGPTRLSVKSCSSTADIHKLRHLTLNCFTLCILVSLLSIITNDNDAINRRSSSNDTTNLAQVLNPLVDLLWFHAVLSPCLQHNTLQYNDSYEHDTV